MFTHNGAKLAQQEKRAKMREVPDFSEIMYGTKHGGTDDFVGNRTPQRVTITLNFAAYKGLERRSALEGRSMSNLAAFILENALTTDSRTDH